MTDLLMKLPFMESMSNLVTSVPTHMDFEGQRVAEYIYQAIIIVCAIVGFVWGFYAERFSITVYCLLGGAAVSCLLVLIPWPFYRQNPLKWQQVKSENKEKVAKSSNKDSKKKR